MIATTEVTDVVGDSLRVEVRGVSLSNRWAFNPVVPASSYGLWLRKAGASAGSNLVPQKYSRSNLCSTIGITKDGNIADSLPPAHTPPPTKLTVLISGSGTNLQALIDASTTGLLPSTTIVRVISNKKGVQGLTRAEKAGIPTTYHNLVFGKYLKSGEKDPIIIQKARAAYDAHLADLVLQDKPDVVVCAGWMHILATSFLEPLTNAQVPVINLHRPPRKGKQPNHPLPIIHIFNESSTTAQTLSSAPGTIFKNGKPGSENSGRKWRMTEESTSSIGKKSWNIHVRE
jgi:hypothetical protein